MSGILGKIVTTAAKTVSKNAAKSAISKKGISELAEEASTKPSALRELENLPAGAVAKQIDETSEVAQKVVPSIEPKNKIKAYKLFKQSKKTGELYPLYVKMKGNKPLEIGKWIKAEIGEQAPSGRVKSSLGELAFRPGFHGGDMPIATHIGRKVDPITLKPTRRGQPNVRADNHVWAEVEFGDDVDWQSIANSRMQLTKDGKPNLATAHITDRLPDGGHYRYKTNPNMTGNWIIGGEMKINRLLSDDEVKAINNQFGVSDLPRLKDLKVQQPGLLIDKKSGGSIERNPYGTNYQRMI